MSTPAWLIRYRRFRSRVRRLKNHFGKPQAANQIRKRTDFTRCEKPVLLIYGFMATRRSLQVMERRLRRDGYCVFSLNLGGLRGAFNNRPVEELAAHVAAKVERMYARYKLGPLTIIGHSKGGLIGAHYVKHLGGHRRVRTLITLGTPHNGTPFAYLGLLIAPVAQSVLEMMPLSPFIRRLKKTPTPRSVWFASIWSQEDAVCPFPAAVVDRGLPNVKNVEVHAPHHDLLLRKHVYDAVHAELANGAAWALAHPRIKEENVAVPQEAERRVPEIDGTLGLPV
ncbi:esterase/lipase family protein [Vulgatibacter sp.]|uniref:esterase/lipase family protein n=1 Tax=Vulgatibacter sp. TaxID=1971226 RepID=UPI00356A05B7